MKLLQRGITKKYIDRSYTCHLLMLYISIKFHENILNGFPFIEPIRNSQISKGNNSKNI